MKDLEESDVTTIKDTLTELSGSNGIPSKELFATCVSWVDTFCLCLTIVLEIKWPLGVKLHFWRYVDLKTRITFWSKNNLGIRLTWCAKYVSYSRREGDLFPTNPTWTLTPHQSFALRENTMCPIILFLFLDKFEISSVVTLSTVSWSRYTSSVTFNGNLWSSKLQAFKCLIWNIFLTSTCPLCFNISINFL